MEKRSNRIEWVDVAKGILIIMVCLGHRNIPKSIDKWIYSFHMPAFFFLAGYTTKYTADLKFGQYLRKKIQGLLVPYFSLGIIYIIIEFLWAQLYRGRVFNFGYYVHQLLIGSYIGSSWFIIALFVTEIMAYCLHGFSKIKYILAIVIGGIGLLLSQILKKQLFWNVNTAFIGLIFFESAQFIRKYGRTHEFKFRKLLCIIGGLSISILCTWINTQVDMLYLEYGNILLFFLGAFSGIVVISFLSIALCRFEFCKRIFTFFGTNTLPIIEYHYTQGYTVTETLYYKAFGLVYGQNELSGNIEGFIHAFTVLVILTPIILIINQFAPWMVGKPRRSPKRLR